MQHAAYERPAENAPIQLGDLLIDLDGYLIRYPDGSDAILTQQEQELLRLLIDERGRVLSYADIGLYAWHYPDRYYSLDGIRCCICRLRRKLGHAANAIQAVRGVGYRFRQDKPSH
jgi:two-component system phosphate regulon response regulator PhoB